MKIAATNLTLTTALCGLFLHVFFFFNFLSHFFIIFQVNQKSVEHKAHPQIFLIDDKPKLCLLKPRELPHHTIFSV